MQISQQEREASLQIVSSSIGRCEKIQPKFAEQSAQASLLSNRLQALYISRALLQQEDIREVYSTTDLEKALPPLSSIIAKCEKALEKHEEGSRYARRFQTMITAIAMARDLVMEELAART